MKAVAERSIETGMQYRGEDLFVYGTLLLPQIMQLVSGRRHFSQPAILTDYARYRLRGKHYPGIAQLDSASVIGMLYRNIRPAAWQRLDKYEDHFYQRQRVQVEVEEYGHLSAWTYVIPDAKRYLLLEHDWSLLQFQQRHLQAFLQHINTRRRF